MVPRVRPEDKARLLAEGDHPAAQFMYEEKEGRRLTVYVRAFGGGKRHLVPFRVRRRRIGVLLGGGSVRLRPDCAIGPAAAYGHCEHCVRDLQPALIPPIPFSGKGWYINRESHFLEDFARVDR